MEEKPNSSETKCLNCGATVTGEFCQACGQRVRDNYDRSLGRLLGEFFGNIFFLDNRFFLSMRYLIQFPGRMTVDFLEGKRKKFISPVTLFLFFNVLYFFINPLSDYSLSLYDQMHQPYYGSFAKDWVETKLEKEGLDFNNYKVMYQNASDNISKSIMILNIPLMAVSVYLMAFKKRPFYFDSLIFSFHFFTVYLISWVMMDWVDKLIILILGDENSLASFATLPLFVLVIPLFYAILAIKRFMNIKWYWAIPAGAGVIVAVTLANLIYRFIIFMVTFWVT